MHWTTCRASRRSDNAWHVAAGPVPSRWCWTTTIRTAWSGSCRRRSRQVVCPAGTDWPACPGPSGDSVGAPPVAPDRWLLSSANRTGEPDAVTADQVVESLREQGGVDPERRAVQVWPALVGGAGPRQPLAVAARGCLQRIDAQATGQLHPAVRLHRQHLPQSDGERS